MNLPPQLYYLATDVTDELEKECRQHFNLHAQWVFANELEREASRMAKFYRTRADGIYNKLVSTTRTLDDHIIHARASFGKQVGFEMGPSKPCAVFLPSGPSLVATS